MLNIVSCFKDYVVFINLISVGWQVHNEEVHLQEKRSEHNKENMLYGT